MKIACIVGTRPQYIKYNMFHKQFNDDELILIDTGQHYDTLMKDVFFKELNIDQPGYCLNIGSGTNGYQIGRGIIGLEKILSNVNPCCTVVFGDCNSTLSGAITSSKLGIPVVHVESGLRCYDTSLPEEVNRVLVDHCSNLLCCPTRNAVYNLGFESLNGFYTGDIRKDSLLFYKDVALESDKVSNLGLCDDFYLATVHRVGNMSQVFFKKLFDRFSNLSYPVVFPMHPRTRKFLKVNDLSCGNVLLVDPVGYLDMLCFLQHCSGVFTDSGGIAVESYILGKNLVVLRGRHEYPCFNGGIVESFGDGSAAVKIANHIRRVYE